MLKDKTIFTLIEGFHLPHRQSSLIEGRIFHYKVPFPLNFSKQPEEDPIEAVVRRYSIKKVFSEILQNSQENTYARVSFLIKLQTVAWKKRLFIKKETLAQVLFCAF